MIVEYHRPQTLEEALSLLARPEPPTAPLGGGTTLHRSTFEPLAVVDLQSLGLDTFAARGNVLELGATLTLQALFGALHEQNQGLGGALRAALERESTYNLRQSATVAGALVSADGRSPFATALLALDAALTLLPGDETISLGDLFPLRSEKLRGRLIARVTIPTNARLAYEYVARTPADRPIVCVAAAVWPSGRTRLALGGFGSAPTLAFDGGESAGAEAAVASAYAGANDPWATAEYRQEVAAVLTRRCLEKLR